jgi:hypothetical protein
LGQVPGGSGLGVNAEDHGVLANGMADGVEKGRTGLAPVSWRVVGLGSGYLV